MIILATDLDRTLLFNGRQEYDGSMERLKRILADESFRLVFVTGRNKKDVESAIEEFSTPKPEAVIGNVGTTLFFYKGMNLVEDLSWPEFIAKNTPHWNTDRFREQMSVFAGLRQQEEDKQNPFKLSYYIDDLKNSDIIISDATKIIKSSCEEAVIVYSIDETHNIGLFDILPRCATKVAALEHLRKKWGSKIGDVVYAGDSGNDLLPLTFGYKSILVANAIPQIKNAVKELSIQKGISDSLYIARGYKKLNGNYVSGIVEGLIGFGLVGSQYAE